MFEIKKKEKKKKDLVKWKSKVRSVCSDCFCPVKLSVQQGNDRTIYGTNEGKSKHQMERLTSQIHTDAFFFFFFSFFFYILGDVNDKCCFDEVTDAFFFFFFLADKRTMISTGDVKHD